MTGDLGLAEDLAQEALVEALEQWPPPGRPATRAPGSPPSPSGGRSTAGGGGNGWTTATGRSRTTSPRRPSRTGSRSATTCCGWSSRRAHPVLSRESQVALTLRVVSGLTTAEIARLLLVPVPTVQARITRAKKTLAAAQVPFETPDPAEWGDAARRRARRGLPRLHRGVRGDDGHRVDAPRPRGGGAPARPGARGARRRGSRRRTAWWR